LYNVLGVGVDMREDDWEDNLPKESGEDFKGEWEKDSYMSFWKNCAFRTWIKRLVDAYELRGEIIKIYKNTTERLRDKWYDAENRYEKEKKLREELEWELKEICGEKE
jgi:hypothetical protein